jgi:F-type H+-transporting ATPase subunit alpha
LEAFAKFGSDLDKSTKQTLLRGARLVELLKQGQFVPMTVEKQVVSIFLGTNGYLDEIALSDVQRFEREFIETLELRQGDVLLSISKTKDLSKDVEEKLHAFAKEFLQKFKMAVK